MNAGLCVRRGCQWPDDLVSERRGCVNARARAAGGGPQLCEPPHDAGAGESDCGTWRTEKHSLRQQNVCSTVLEQAYFPHRLKNTPSGFPILPLNLKTSYTSQIRR
jgi:hypothetical protein